MPAVTAPVEILNDVGVPGEGVQRWQVPCLKITVDRLAQPTGVGARQGRPADVVVIPLKHAAIRCCRIQIDAVMVPVPSIGDRNEEVAPPIVEVVFGCDFPMHLHYRNYLVHRHQELSRGKASERSAGHAIVAKKTAAQVRGEAD